MPVTVSYATADGTAVSTGTNPNYTASTGTLTFTPGVTTQTIRVPILDSGSQTTALTFTVNLSSPQVATLSQSQATGTIEPSEQAAKFYVLNNPNTGVGGNLATFKYQASGTEQAPFALNLNDLDPQGIAANPSGTEEWIADRNGNVYVYSSAGTFLGSWTPGGLPSGDTPDGIATDGTNIWVLDATSNKIFEYTGAAGRLSGSQNAASSFKVTGTDAYPANIVTDGKSIWVVDNGDGKVFKYTVGGQLLGSWALDPADIDPTGITIDPNNVSDIWTVDAYTREVYDYSGAASRTSGKQNAAAAFALAAGNTVPYGIADPPPADMLLTPAAVSGQSNVQGMTVPSSASVSSSGSPLSGFDQLFTDLALLMSDARNAYQSELSSVTTLWQRSDARALQRLDDLLSLGVEALEIAKDTPIREVLLASMSTPNVL